MAGGSTIPTAHFLTVDDAAHHLYSVVPEVNIPHLAFTIITVFILVFGMFSALIKERLYAGEAIVATAFGIIFGPYAADLFNPRTWSREAFDDITLEFTRIVLALAVFAIGVELPRAYVKRHWRSLAMMLGPIMVVGWLVTGGLICAIIPGMTFLGSLIIAAALIPTDPILAASVVGKGKFAQKHVPSHIRNLLQSESGCNDGAAFPLLYLALFLNFREARSVGYAIGMWIVLVILYQIILGCIIGIVIGVAARKILKFSKRRALIDRESMVAMYVSLAIFTTAVTTLAGSDDLLAAFACGSAFAWDDWFSESIEDSNFSNIIDLLVNCATFIYIGATMPFSDFGNDALTLSPWRLVVLAICVLLVRRLPVVLALYKWIPDIKTFREAVFAGHFGPMGVGAIFIATLALTKLPTPTYPPEVPDDYLALNIQPIVYFVVLSSVIIHGTSIPFFNLGKRVHSIHRTWTQGSNAEPSWLSRVKRVGDNSGNNDDDDPNSREKRARAYNNEKQGHNRDAQTQSGERDLESGETAIDDPGMDIGEMTERDYADGDQYTGGNGGILKRTKNISPTASSDTRTDDRDLEAGGSNSGEKDEHLKEKRALDGLEEGHEDEPMADRRSRRERNKKKLEEEEQDDEACRRERHDDHDDEEEVWEEGGEEIVETGSGDDAHVIHRNKQKEGRDRSESRDSRHSTGPGFPGHDRMAEIAHMLERGLGHGHEEAEESSDEREEEEDAHRGRVQEEEDHSRNISERNDASGSFPVRQASKARSTRSTSGQREPEQRSRTPSAAAPAPESKSSTAPTPHPQHPGILSRMTTLGAGMMPRPTKSGAAARRPTLTAEEKLARDALCRRERRDLDDDEVKAWISGKHLIIERNKGEDVEIVDANPSQDARDTARKNPDLNVKEVTAPDVKRAKEGTSARDGESTTTGSSTPARDAPPKRFDLRSMPGRESFRKMFGGSEASTSRAPDNSRQAQRVASPVQEEEADPESGRLRFAEQPAERPPGEASAAPVKKTGIAMDRTETTDSQIRFGDLPKPVRRKKK